MTLSYFDFDLDFRRLGNGNQRCIYTYNSDGSAGHVTIHDSQITTSGLTASLQYDEYLLTLLGPGDGDQHNYMIGRINLLLIA